ncbi:sugar phosphate isomerase/epimerase family protein [Fredinandcohnia onubensis]|uniref:sugar phosphate isomerase/epimerase family protein n=1 Tax=Fredinandcohnia onubensis TaxID=1571209 RepID=UPI000C0BD1FA|nr:sugar phosphate isomerase/epimerase family protein [Fredinandcohnia onubensis]
MKLQNFQRKNVEVIKKFIEIRKEQSFKKPSQRLNLSWSNWGFGTEPLEVSAERLARNNVKFIELHGNRYGKDLGYKTDETKKVLDSYGIQVSGVCGMVFPDSEFASNSPLVRQRAIDYFRRNIDLCQELGGTYILFAPGAVGRPKKYDDNEYLRAAETIGILGDYFIESGVRGAIEPVRPEEVSFCHTFADAKKLIDMINHPGVTHIAGDIFHMLVGEEHIGAALVEYGDILTNLHLADTNRRALGTGLMDLDIIQMALYVIGYNNPKAFCSAEPLGLGGNPYEAMHGSPDPVILDEMVSQTATYFYERENELLNATEEDLNKLITSYGLESTTL